MSVSINLHADRFRARDFGSFATVEMSDGEGSSADVYLHSPAECDALIKAAVAAKSMLLAGTSEPVLPPEGDCEEPHPDTGEPCTRGPRHAGGHVDSHGRYWPRHDGGSEDLDAALTPPGYSLPAGELASEDAR